MTEKSYSLFQSVQTSSGAQPNFRSTSIGCFFPPKVKRPKREYHHPHTYSDDVKNEWSCTSISNALIGLRGVFGDNFTFPRISGFSLAPRSRELFSSVTVFLTARVNNYLDGGVYLVALTSAKHSVGL